MTTKRSLHVGTNYVGTDAALSGCVADAESWAGALEARGYEAWKLLNGDASRRNVLDAMTELVESAKYGDRVVLSNSSHGSWIPDMSGDELDHRDEVILPDDFRTAGPISDDDLYSIFSSAARGVRVVFISDSCFSGTLNRFAPPIHVGDGIVHRRPRFLPPAAFLDRRALGLAELAERAPAAGKFRRSGLVMSACSDQQVTYDAVVDGRPCGLFTHVALTALERVERITDEMPEPTYRDWHRAIRAALPSVDYPDVTPQLDGTSDQKRWTVLA